MSVRLEPAPRPAKSPSSHRDPAEDGGTEKPSAGGTRGRRWSFAAGADVVCGLRPTAEGLVFLPRAAAEELATIHGLFESRQPTWGEVKSALDAWTLEELVPRIEDVLEDAGLPLDIDPTAIPDDLEVWFVEGLDEGDWPERPDGVMVDWIPDGIARRHGFRDEGFISGEILVMKDDEAFTQALIRAGAKVTRDDALIGTCY